jgi:hypothetical protein
LIKALKALCLAFSRRSSSVSFSICLVSLAIRSLSLLTRKISLSSCYGFAGLRLHPQLVLNLALLVLHHAQLVAGIPSPIQHRENCRQRGSDERDAPLLLELQGAAGKGDVVIGGKRAIRPSTRPPSTWSTPRRSRPSQRPCSDGDSGGSGGSGVLLGG